MHQKLGYHRRSEVNACVAVRTEGQTRGLISLEGDVMITGAGDGEYVMDVVGLPMEFVQQTALR